jgi:hypothetical protein
MLKRECECRFNGSILREKEMQCVCICVGRITCVPARYSKREILGEREIANQNVCACTRASVCERGKESQCERVW